MSVGCFPAFPSPVRPEGLEVRARLRRGTQLSFPGLSLRGAQQLELGSTREDLAAKRIERIANEGAFHCGKEVPSLEADVAVDEVAELGSDVADAASRRAFVCHFVCADAEIPGKDPENLLRLRG